MSGRGRVLLLTGLLVVLAGWYAMQRLVQEAGPAAAPGGRAAGVGLAAGGAARVEELQLGALGPSREVDATPDRNVFRFEQRRAQGAEPPQAGVREPSFAPAPVVPGGPGVPAGPPPIPLRYIGFLDEMGDKPRIAVLSDGRGSVFNGREGDIIDGRYRLERIGTESAELVYVDGRGRQTLRLSGQ